MDREPAILRFFSRGIRPGMSFESRRELHILNGGAWLIMTMATVFTVAGRLVPGSPPVWPNFVLICSGIAGLAFLSSGRRQAAVIVMNVTAGAAFLYQGYFYRTGAHSCLLVVVVTTAFLVRRSFWQSLVVVAFIAGYLAIEYHQLVTAPARPVKVGRYMANLTLASACIYGFIALFREVNDAYRRRVDRQNRELQEANAAKEKVFSILAHDLRGPVASLKSGLDLLDEGAITPAEFAEMKDDLKKGVDAVFASLENLLEWSAGQMHAVRHEPVRVVLRDALAEDVRLLERIAAGKRIAVENRLPEGAAARADLHQLHAVFRNLVSNALKFTPRGGLVEVTAEPAEAGRWAVTVRDNGIGMEPEHAARLFDGKTFRSTRGTGDEKGLGLGLQICRDFVRLHGGEIAVESAPGRGTAFRFTLPAWEEGAFSIPKGGASC